MPSSRSSSIEADTQTYWESRVGVGKPIREMAIRFCYGRVCSVEFGCRHGWSLFFALGFATIQILPLHGNNARFQREMKGAKSVDGARLRSEGERTTAFSLCRCVQQWW